MLGVVLGVIVALVVLVVVAHFLLVDTTMDTHRPDLHGKVVVVTGTTSGIGAPTAVRLAECGARVILANRDVARSEKQARDLAASTNNPNIEHVTCDLADLASVAACAAEIRRRLGPEGVVDIVVANAGVMACPLMATKQGYEYQYGVNHLGHFALIGNLLPDMLQRSQEPRVVLVSSVGHTFTNTLGLGTVHADAYRPASSYRSMVAYARSKLANILTANELARRFGESRLHAYSLMPGNINTNLGRYFNPVLLFVAAPLLWALQKTVVQGAQTTLMCSLAPVGELQNGGYYDNCRIKTPSALARDRAAAEQLWETTLAQVDAFLTPEARQLLQK